MRRMLLGVLLAVSLSANAVIAGFALRRAAAPAGATTPPLFAKVALDGDQKARIAALRERLLAERADEAKRLADLRGALAQQLVRDPQDERSLDAILTRIEAAQHEFQRRVVAHVVAVRAVLRPDQRPVFEELVAAQMRGGTPFDPSRGPAEGGSR
jgi:nickel and cobalt resistance protein CnrR